MRDYKFGTKNNWRRWKWNRIRELIEGPLDERVVLYLPASEDLDRPEALRRGFRSENLIACDRDGSIVAALRKQGRPVLRGDIFDVALAYRAEAIAAIDLDLQSGLELSVLRRLWPILLKHPTAVLALNIMRGRDGSFSYFREGAIEWQKNLGLHQARAHRGRWAVGVLISLIFGTIGLPWKRYQDRVVAQQLFERAMDVNFHEYRSGRLIFDSAVFRGPISVLRLGIPEIEITLGEGTLAAIERCSDSYRRQIAALTAHRTRGTYRATPDRSV